MNPPVGTRHTGESPICEICRSGKQEPFCIGCERLRDHDAAIREDERKNVLNEVKEGIDRYMVLAPEARGHHTIHKGIWKVIGSLRATTPASGNREK